MSDYKKSWETYRNLHDKGAEGDRQARKDKLKAHQECIAIEREAARDGVILESGKQVGTMPTKRSMQEEYIRRFDDKATVEIGGKSTNLRAWHTERLLGK